MKINALTPAEENLMLLIWKLGSPFMKDIMEALPEPKPHHNTVSTYLKILVEKEYLSTEKIGRIFKYSTAVPFEEYRKFILAPFLENFFNNSASELLKMLISENLLKPSDLNDYFEIKTAVVPIVQPKEETKGSDISSFITELTSDKQKKVKDKKKKRKKK